MFGSYKRGLSLFLSLVLICSPVFAGDITGLAADWRLEESSGTRVDQSSEGNDLTDNNTVNSNTGVFGDAADLETSNSEYLSRPDANLSNLEAINSDFTFNCHVQRESTGQHTIAGKGTAFTTGIHFFISGGNAVIFYVGNDPLQASGTWSTTGSWRHFGFTYDHSEEDAHLYVDGSLDVSDLTTTGDWADNANPFVLGTRSSAPSAYFDGLLDECNFFNRVLNESEIDDIYNNGMAAFTAPSFLPTLLIMMIKSPLALVPFSLYRGNNIYKYRKKFVNRDGSFAIPIPSWMKIYEVPEAIAKTVNSIISEEEIEWDKRRINDSRKRDGKYQQRGKRTKNGITYETHVYDGPSGVGYIQRATKEIDGEKWIKERHFGPEKRTVNETWTKLNEGEPNE